MDRELEQKLIRIGAQAHLSELRSEVTKLETYLGMGQRESTVAETSTATDTGGRRPWTAAMRKAQSERLKARWAKKKR